MKIVMGILMVFLIAACAVEKPNVEDVKITQEWLDEHSIQNWLGMPVRKLLDIQGKPDHITQGIELECYDVRFYHVGRTHDTVPACKERKTNSYKNYSYLKPRMQHAKTRVNCNFSAKIEKGKIEGVESTCFGSCVNHPVSFSQWMRGDISQDCIVHDR